ncbi:hypothetical protein I7I51_08764, partial [Histoplasma capsulatum]
CDECECPHCGPLLERFHPSALIRRDETEPRE